eukprot:TRINITY_DN48867_c0_g1_i1.p1 TRINITY_DN48867_c0_g1~~TRINITY_DN48867_c0_g1_i1.p1  ORF type:complete len:130 (+),score=14.77 TRINITY_DN48867_c0_g1_i1:93-482(+)
MSLARLTRAPLRIAPRLLEPRSKGWVGKPLQENATPSSQEVYGGVQAGAIAFGIGPSRYYAGFRPSALRMMDTYPSFLERCFFNIFWFIQTVWCTAAIVALIVFWEWGGFQGTFTDPYPSLYLAEDEAH